MLPVLLIITILYAFPVFEHLAENDCVAGDLADWWSKLFFERQTCLLSELMQSRGPQFLSEEYSIH